jgi:hypothetical protein
VLERLAAQARGDGALRSFVTQFADARLVERDRGYALIVTSGARADWIAKRYLEQVKAALGTDDVTIEVDDAVASSGPTSK